MYQWHRRSVRMRSARAPLKLRQSCPPANDAGADGGARACGTRHEVVPTALRCSDGPCTEGVACDQDGMPRTVQ